jgi:hypothetical protein
LSDVKTHMDHSSYLNKDISLSYYDGLMRCYVCPFLTDELIGYLSLTGIKYWKNLDKFNFKISNEDFMELYYYNNINPYDIDENPSIY